MMSKKEKKPVHYVQLTEDKRQIIRQLLSSYNIESTQLYSIGSEIFALIEKTTSLKYTVFIIQVCRTSEIKETYYCCATIML